MLSNSLKTCPRCLQRYPAHNFFTYLDAENGLNGQSICGYCVHEHAAKYYPNGRIENSTRKNFGSRPQVHTKEQSK